MRGKKQQLEPSMEQMTSHDWERTKTRLYNLTPFISLISRVHNEKCQAGRATSWNQDCWEKYQQLQIRWWYHSNGREEELKSLSMRVKEESDKAGLKLNLKKTKIIAFGPIISQQIDGEKVETVTDFLFLSSKIIADGNCNYEIKRCLLHGRKTMSSLDRVLESKDFTMLTKVSSSQSHCFSSSHVWMWVLDHKKAEHWRMDAFELWCWRRLLTLGPQGDQIKSNSLEGLMLKLKLQYFGHLMRRANSLEKTLMLDSLKAGGEGDNRGWDSHKASPAQWTWRWANPRWQWRTRRPGVHGVVKSGTELSVNNKLLVKRKHATMFLTGKRESSPKARDPKKPKENKLSD